jgi:hypothetical protein
MCLIKMLWATDLPSLTHLPCADLLHDPKCVACYTAELKKRLLQHRIPAQLFALEKSILANPDDSLTPEQAKEANTMDNLRTQCMLGAEKKCRKLCTGKVPYSPKGVMIGSEICYWDAILDRILKKPVNARTLKRLKKAAGVTMITRHLSIEQVKDLSWDVDNAIEKPKPTLQLIAKATWSPCPLNNETATSGWRSNKGRALLPAPLPES